MEQIKENLSDSLSTLYSHSSDSVDDYTRNTIEIQCDDSIELSKLKSAVHFVQVALDEEITPILVDDCTGGTYLCLNKYEGYEAVFKPTDEEPYCINNPKGLLPNQFLENNRGILPGTSYLREIAAYTLDHHHFAGVPETTLASITYESYPYEIRRKCGSLQLYIPHECSSEDYGPSMFSLENIQKIALLDIRMFNLDRHENNLLVCSTRGQRSLSIDYSVDMPQSRTTRSGSFCRSSELHLIPIDHGYSLPVMTTQAVPEWCWMHWFHSQVPLTKEAKEYVLALDVEADIALLRSSLPLIETSALNTLRITTRWMQLCVKANCSLHQMAQFFIPAEGPSPFQSLVTLYLTQYESMSFSTYLQQIGMNVMMTYLQTICSYYNVC